MSAAQRRYDAWRAALLGEETREEMFFRRVAYERARTRALGAEWARGDDVDATASEDARRSVAMDVERLPNEDPVRASQMCVTALKRILLTHACGSGGKRGYRQGMHEVASMVLETRASAAEYSKAATGTVRWDRRDDEEKYDDGDGSFATTSYDEREIASAGSRDYRFVEHDAHALFEAFMGDARGERDDERLALGTYYEDATTPTSPICAAFRRIENALRSLDENLAKKLVKMEVEPQLYLLRWLRLGFGREFHRRDVLTLWDAIFESLSAAIGENGETMSSRDFYEGIAVSVLMTMRNDILSLDDFGAVMSRLQNVPPGIQMQHMIARAKAMAVTGLLKYDETDGMKIFTSRKPPPPHRSSPNRLVVPHIRGKAPPSVQTIARWDSDAISVDGSIDSLSVQAGDDDDDACEKLKTHRPRDRASGVNRARGIADVARSFAGDDAAFARGDATRTRRRRRRRPIHGFNLRRDSVDSIPPPILPPPPSSARRLRASTTPSASPAPLPPPSGARSRADAADHLRLALAALNDAIAASPEREVHAPRRRRRRARRVRARTSRIARASAPSPRRGKECDTYMTPSDIRAVARLSRPHSRARATPRARLAGA